MQKMWVPKQQRVRNKMRSSFFIFQILPVLLGALFVSILVRPVHADPLPVVHVSGTLSSNQTWTNGNVYVVDDTLTVPDGKTLTINAGTIVKYNNIQYSYNYGLRVSQGGTLNVNGVSGSEVIFTSYRDDNVGGDSNGDGSATSTAEGVQEDIESNSGTVNISYADFRSGSGEAVGISCATSTTTNSITDSKFAGSLWINHCDNGKASILRNQFNVPSNANSYGVWMFYSDASGLPLSGANSNAFSGADKGKAVYLNYSKVSANNSWTVDPSSGAILYILDELAIGGTVNLQPGTIVKIEGYNDYSALYVDSGGRLNVNGDSDASVIFTSYRDDNVGGNSNGDSNTPIRSDYQSTIKNVKGGDLAIKYADFRFGSGADVGVACTSGDETNDIEDSVFTNSFALNNCNEGAVNLRRNHFNLSDTNAWAISIASSYWSGIKFAGNDKNTFSGPGKMSTAYFYNSKIAAGENVTISSDDGAKFEFDNLKIDGTLNIEDGSIVKFPSYREQWPSTDPTITLKSGAELNVNGTANSKVIFTSDEDDSYGGDATQDGATAGQPQDYYTVVQAMQDSTLNMSNANVKYANRGVIIDGGTVNINNIDIANVTTGVRADAGDALITDANIHDSSLGVAAYGGKVVFRGTLNTQMGAEACNWGGDCNADVAYTNWNNGSDPTAAPIKACGSVWIYPWTNAPPTYSGLYLPNCDGSPTPSAKMSSSATNLNNALADDYSNCADVDNGTDPACNIIRTTKTCLNSALGLAEQNASFVFPAINPLSTSDYVNGMVGATTTYVESAVNPTPTQFALGATGEIYNGVKAVVSVKNAYDGCLSSAQ